MAQEVGADGRTPELPPMKDRQTMARRVRGYVTTSKGEVYGSSTTAGRATSAERKALATMGRRGGKKAAERWETDPDGKYAQSRRAVMKKTHKRKKIEGVGNRQKVGQFITSYWMETEQLPTWQEIQQETGLSRATVARHISALKKLGEYPEI